ncbi:MAG TPA: glycosyltransferase family 4 protein [Polyangiaceae bacterium]|jgi:glycosyltransferase involved in cell wall biosynthesis|nr:glycosyltransferase family 4 protein [Polyangiaceae bacterium]
MTRKKLAILTHEFYPVLSGGTIFTDKLAIELAKIGYDVDILTARLAGDFPAVERRDGITIRRYRTARESVGDATLAEHLTYFALGAPQMLAEAARARYDLLFPVFAIPSGLTAVLIQQALRIPSVVFVDAADTPGVQSAMNSYVRHLASLFRFVTHRSAGVVICEGLEDMAMPYIVNPHVTAIPNGAVIPVERARPGEHGPKLEILSIGRLVLRKGFQDIIRALGIVKKKRSDLHLKVIGYGKGEDEIMRVLAEHDVTDLISFVGRVEYRDLGSHYLGSDAYLFYGDREGSSLAMIEAVAYGLPVLASDHPGNRTYVDHGKSGYLVEYGKPEALAASLLALLEERDRLPEMGRRSRELGESYSWAKIAERYDGFFRQVLGAG